MFIKEFKTYVVVFKVKFLTCLLKLFSVIKTHFRLKCVENLNFNSILEFSYHYYVKIVALSNFLKCLQIRWVIDMLALKKDLNHTSPRKFSSIENDITFCIFTAYKKTCK